MCEERMSWNMPTFHWHENIIHFAIFKNHIGLYPGASAMVHFSNELQKYKTSKGAIQLPLNEPIPYKLIEEIVKYRIKEVN